MVSSKFKKLFLVNKPIIAMIHVFKGDINSRIKQAMEDLDRLQPHVDGLIVENYDCGHFNANLGTDEISNALEIVAKSVISESSIPIGINVIPNDYEKALNICGKVGASFIQLDHVTGQFTECDQVDSKHLTLVRSQFPEVALLGGIHPKYYKLSDEKVKISDTALTAMYQTDAIVVTGNSTGEETLLDDLQVVKSVVGEHPLIIGSGLTIENLVEQLSIADAAIVGTAFKVGGVKPGEEIDENLVKSFMDKVKTFR